MWWKASVYLRRSQALGTNPMIPSTAEVTPMVVPVSHFGRRRRGGADGAGCTGSAMAQGIEAGSPRMGEWRIGAHNG